MTALIFLSGILNVAAQTPNLDIQKIDKGSTIIAELDNPAVFDFVVDNNGPSDLFEIYSLVGVSMTPKGKFEIPHGETTIEVMAFPNEDIRKSTKGYFNFEYQIKGQNSGIFKDFLLIKIVPLEESLAIEAEPLHPSNSKAVVILKNKENTNIENLEINLESEFFSSKKTVSIGPKEELELEIEVNKEDTKKIVAGSYIVSAEIKVDDADAELETIMTYLEKEGTSVERYSDGFILKRNTVVKRNEGNVPVTATIEVKKDILSRLFTITSPESDQITRSGLVVSYFWARDLSPGESFSITTTTNYTIPLIFLILIVLAGLIAKKLAETAVTLNKRVSLVRTKKGEFAVKVRLHVKAKRHVDKIQITDQLPGVTKLYENFGKTPDRIDKTSRRLFWNISSLNAGEERVYSYIIYSKLNIVGKFELPAATAVFEHNGKMQEAWSNRAFFITETAGEK